MLLGINNSISGSLSAPFAFPPDLFKKQGTALVIDIIELLLLACALFAGVHFGDIFVAQIFWYFALAKGQSSQAKEKSDEKNEANGQRDGKQETKKHGFIPEAGEL